MFALLLGFFCGYFLSRLLIPARSKDNRLILAIAMLTGISGICTSLNISPLLSCMVFGAAYINLTRDKKLYRQLNNFTPPIMSLFFIVSGMKLDIGALSTVGVIGLCYFLIRIVGKYVGTYVGCAITGMSREARRYMGLALVPQAGVAIGLAFLGERLLPGERGQLLLTIILSSSVLYEMVGPICAKLALIFSGCITLDSAVNAEMAEIEGAVEAGETQTQPEAAQEESAEEPVSVDGPPQEEEPPGKEEDAQTDVSLVEHFEELEMGVENQEIEDIESYVHTEKEEHDEKVEKTVKSDKRKKKEKKKSAGKH